MDMKISGESSTLVLTSSLPAVAFTDGKQKFNTPIIMSLK